MLKRIPIYVLAAALIAAGCSSELPTGKLAQLSDQTVSLDRGGEHPGGTYAQVLNSLRAATAKWHNLDVAMADGYGDATGEVIGCVDERYYGVGKATARGIGYPLLNEALVAGEEADVSRLLEPELVVYGKNPHSGKLELAAFDYFIPASDTWPSPDDGGTPPTLPEIGLPFTWLEAFHGWTFHIWAWWHNPDGMFATSNSTVPLCQCEVSPSAPACTPEG